MNITLLGAGGKMGGRITANLQNLPQYHVDYVEASEAGRKQLADAVLRTASMEEALGRTQAVILAVPDRLIGKITHEVIPKLKLGTMVVGLDPAAAYAGVMPQRDDVTYFIAHPCHPPLFSDSEPASANSDWFGVGRCWYSGERRLSGSGRDPDLRGLHGKGAGPLHASGLQQLPPYWPGRPSRGRRRSDLLPAVRQGLVG
jgi:hypothetical protein